MSSHILASGAPGNRIGISIMEGLLTRDGLAGLEHERAQAATGAARDGEALAQALSEQVQKRRLGRRALALEQRRRWTAGWVATRLVQAGCPRRDWMVEEEDLEDYFLRLVGAARVHMPCGFAPYPPTPSPAREGGKMRILSVEARSAATLKISFPFSRVEC